MSSKTNKNILNVEGVTKKYNNKAVVKDISFSVREGEIFGILGPNGAGKTTTLEMIETLRPIDEGKITINGIDAKKDPVGIRKTIGVQTQSSAFYDKVRLHEQLKLLIAIYKSSAKAETLLADVELSEKANDFFEKLSGGQKQRFSIAAALTNDPRVLILDEPTTGLDPQARRSLWDLIRKINTSGTTVVLTTHYMEEAQVLCDRVAIMEAGKIIALETPKKLIQNLLDTGFEKKEVVQQADLEDVFINLTGKALRD